MGGLRWKAELEAGDVGAPLVRERAPVRHGDGAGEREAEAGALGLGGEERLEELGEPGAVDALAAVLDQDMGRVGPSPDLDLDGGLPRGRLDRVAYQVVDRARHGVRVDHRGRLLAGDVDPDAPLVGPRG